MEVVMLNYVYVAVAIIVVIRVVWRMPLPDRSWGNANQSFSKADEEVTRLVNDEIK